MKKMIYLVTAIMLIFSCAKQKRTEIKEVALFNDIDIEQAALKNNYSENNVRLLLIKEFQDKTDSLLRINNPTSFDNYAIYQHLKNIETLIYKTELSQQESKNLSVWINEKTTQIKN